MGSLATENNFGFQANVLLRERDLSACRDAECPYYEINGSSPIYQSCPHGHDAGERSEQGRNQFLTIGIDAIISQIDGTLGSPSLKILFVAAGTSTTPNDDTTTGLYAEIFRSAPVESQRLGKVVDLYYKQRQTNFFYGIRDANGTLSEFALISGAASPYPAIDGIALARFLPSPAFDKTVTKTLSGQWVITGGNP